MGKRPRNCSIARQRNSQGPAGWGAACRGSTSQAMLGFVQFRPLVFMKGLLFANRVCMSNDPGKFFKAREGHCSGLVYSITVLLNKAIVPLVLSTAAMETWQFV